MTTPRGIRNHNPGNLKAGSAWRGLVEERDGFAVFKDAAHGIRAAAMLLQVYQTRHGLDTLAGALARWAPPEDNNPTEAYVASVAIWSGFEADEAIDFYDYDTAHRVLRAMFRFENGRPPAAEYWYSDAIYEQGLRLAGLTPDKPLTKSRTIKGAATAATSITAAIGVLTDTLGVPSEIAALLPGVLGTISNEAASVVLLVIGLAGAGVALWARRDDKARGRL